MGQRVTYQRVSHVSQIQARKLEGSLDAIMVSIVGPSGSPCELQSGWRAILRVYFSDSDQEGPDSIQPHHAEQILDFLDKWSNQVVYIVIHCAAGVSRSAAVARFAAERYDLPFDWSYYSYNKLVYKRLLEAASKREST